MSESSTENELPEGQTVEGSDANADSSPAQGESYLDAVLGALKDKGESPASAQVAEKAPEAQAEPEKSGEAKPDPDELTPDELKRLPQKTQKRIQDLLGERKTLTAELEPLKVAKQRLDNITEQFRSTGLDGKDIDTVLEIGTLLKRGDLFAAREKLAPIWEVIQRATGSVIPADIADAHKAGQISEQHARELAEARARAQSEQQLRQSQVAEQQRAAERQQAEQFQATVVKTVNDWEAGKRQRDPDCNLKAPQVRQQIKLELLDPNVAKPQSAQEAVQMAEKALATVDAMLRQFRPAPRAVQHVSGSPSGPRSVAAPKTHHDVVFDLLGMSR